MLGKLKRFLSIGLRNRNSRTVVQKISPRFEALESRCLLAAWDGDTDGDGDGISYDDDDNWDTGTVPGAGEIAIIGTAAVPTATVRLPATDVNNSQLRNEVGTANVVLGGAKYTLTNGIAAGRTGDGTLNLTSNATAGTKEVEITGTGRIEIGAVADKTGILTVTGDNVAIVNRGSGSFTLGPSMSSAGEAHFSDGATWNSGGNSANSIVVGRFGSGELRVESGAAIGNIIGPQEVIVGRRNTGTALVTGEGSMLRVDTFVPPAGPTVEGVLSVGHEFDGDAGALGGTLTVSAGSDVVVNGVTVIGNNDDKDTPDPFDDDPGKGQITVENTGSTFLTTDLLLGMNNLNDLDVARLIVQSNATASTQTTTLRNGFIEVASSGIFNAGAIVEDARLKSDGSSLGSTISIDVNNATLNATSIDLDNTLQTTLLSVQAGGKLSASEAVALRHSAVVTGGDSELTTLDTLRYKDGLFQILDGGFVDTANDVVFSPGVGRTADVLVDGTGIASPTKLEVGGSLVGAANGTTKIDIDNGALVTAAVAKFGGDDPNSGGTADQTDGTFVQVLNGSQLNVTGELQVGQRDRAVLTINSSTVTSGSGVISAFGDPANPETSQVTVTGAGAKWTVAGTLTNAKEDKGIIEVLDGGIIDAGKVENKEDGTIRGDDGKIIGATENEGRFIIGSSPGTFEIDGDYEQFVTGTLEIELGGLTVGDDYDQLQITNGDDTVGGNAMLGGTLDVSFIDGFESSVQAGDTFSVLTATAGLSGEFETVDFGDAVLADGFAWQVVYDRTTADGDGLEVVLEVLPPVEVEVDAVAIEAALSSYSPGTDFDFTDQDTNSIAAVVDNGATLQIDGDGWKKIALPYNVTASTVLEFDFASTSEGEIHGIGFDNDDVQSEELTFRLFGTQAWGIHAFNNYVGGGAAQHYVIPVGQFYTGDMEFLTFINDHDVSDPTASSVFSNIQIYDDPSLAPLLSVNEDAGQAVEVYGGALQNSPGELDVETRDDDLNTTRETLSLTGNGWRKVDFDYVVTADTVLEFDFSSTSEGEIHAIGFDNNNSVSTTTTRRAKHSLFSCSARKIGASVHLMITRSLKV